MSYQWCFQALCAISLIRSRQVLCKAWLWMRMMTICFYYYIIIISPLYTTISAFLFWTQCSWTLSQNFQPTSTAPLIFLITGGATTTQDSMFVSFESCIIISILQCPSPLLLEHKASSEEAFIITLTNKSIHYFKCMQHAGRSPVTNNILLHPIGMGDYRL